MKKLLESGANLKIKDRKGRTAQDVAAQSVLDAFEDRESDRVRMALEDDRRAIFRHAQLLRSQREEGAITDWELEDATKRKVSSAACFILSRKLTSRVFSGGGSVVDAPAARS